MKDRLSLHSINHPFERQCHRLKATSLRPEIKIIQEYGDLPEIDCFPGQLNQVFMNLLANAVDMFDEMAECTSNEKMISTAPQITVKTQLLEQDKVAEICIADNGKGMSEKVLEKIFDRQFTTKAVGKGTGLGLAIAHQIVVNVHNGNLNVESKVGQGTKFCIRLPIN